MGRDRREAAFFGAGLEAQPASLQLRIDRATGRCDVTRSVGGRLNWRFRALTRAAVVDHASEVVRMHVPNDPNDAVFIGELALGHCRGEGWKNGTESARENRNIAAMRVPSG